MNADSRVLQLGAGDSIQTSVSSRRHSMRLSSEIVEVDNVSVHPKVKVAVEVLNRMMLTSSGLTEIGSQPPLQRTFPTEEEIVTASGKSVNWVHAWYALHNMDNTLKISKSKCEVSTDRLHCCKSLDHFVAPVDDTLIKCSQNFVKNKRCRNPFKLLAQFFTMTTIIEIGPIFPIVFYSLCLDDIAILSLAVILVIVIVSQIPKRFCWRYRPFFDYRAVRMKTNKTSSFPSRALVCAVAYSYIAALCSLNIPYYFESLPVSFLTLQTIFLIFFQVTNFHFGYLMVSTCY